MSSKIGHWQQTGPVQSYFWWVAAWHTATRFRKCKMKIQFSDGRRLYCNGPCLVFCVAAIFGPRQSVMLLVLTSFSKLNKTKRVVDKPNIIEKVFLSFSSVSLAVS